MKSEIDRAPVTKRTRGGRGEVAISKHVYKCRKSGGSGDRVLVANEMEKMSEKGCRDPERERERAGEIRAKGQPRRVMQHTTKKDTTSTGFDEQMSITS